MPPTVKEKTVSGFKWLAFNQAGERIIKLVAVAILARLLEPTVFGLFAMAFIVIDGFSLIKSFGIDGALIQKRITDPDFERAKHTAFWLVQIVGVSIFLIFQITAPFVGKLLNNQDVVSVMHVLGTIFLIGNLGRIPNAMLTKKMKFKILSTLELIGSVLNAVIAVSLALKWPSIWCLVAAYLAKQIFVSAGCWFFEPFRVKFIFDRECAKKLFHFGKFTVGSSLLGFFSFHIDHFLISRMLGAAQLGFYVLAQNVTAFTNIQVMRHIGRVLFPAISSIQDDPDAIKRAVLKISRFTSVIAIPYTFGIMTVAPDVVLALYGEKWLSIAPLIQVLAVGQLFGPLLGCAGSVYLGCGKPHYGYRLMIARLTLNLIFMITLMRLYGLMGLVWSHILTQSIMFPVNLYLVKRLSGFSLWSFVKQLLPAAFSTAVMVAAVIAVKSHLDATTYWRPWDFHNILPCIAFALAGLPAYIGSLWLLDKETVKEAFDLLIRRKVKPRPVTAAVSVKNDLTPHRAAEKGNVI